MRNIIAGVLAVSVAGIAVYGNFKEELGLVSSMKVALPEALKDDAKAYDAVLVERPDTGLDSQDVYEALFALSDGAAVITVDSYAEEAGGVVATGVTIKAADADPEFDYGVSIDEFRLYGFDLDGIMGYAMGGTSTELTAAERIDLQGIKLIGPNTDTMPSIEKDFGAQLTALNDEADGAPQFYFTTDQMVIDNVKLYPVDQGAAEGPMGMVSLIAQAVRGGSIDAWVSKDITFGMVMPEPNYLETEDEELANRPAGTAMILSLDMSGMGDLNRGDLGNILTSGLKMKTAEIASVWSEEMARKPVKTMTSKYTLDASATSDLRLSSLLIALGAGEMPDMDDTDLISGGLHESYNDAFYFNGKKVYASGKQVVDLTSFHWLLPTKIDVVVEDLYADIGGVLDMVGEMVVEEEEASAAFLASFEDETTDLSEPDEAPFSAGATILAVSDILKKHDADTLNMDGRVLLTWDPEDGGLVFQAGKDIDTFAAFKLNLVGGLLTYDSLKEIAAEAEAAMTAEMAPPPAPDEMTGEEEVAQFADDALEAAGEMAAADEGEVVIDSAPEPETPSFDPQAAFAAAAMQDAYFEKLVISHEDKGGLKKISLIAADSLALIPTDTPAEAFISQYREASAEELLNAAAGLISLGSMQAAQMFPPAAAYLGSLSSFIIQGGVFEIKVEPGQRITAAGVQQFIATEFNEPSDIVDYAGLEVTHTPPEGDSD